MKKLITTIILFSLISANSYALTGSELKKYLIEFNSSSSTSPWGPYAVGYVLGVTDAVRGFLICSSGVTNKERTSVVLAYLFSNPDKLDKNADELVVAALSAKWPCDKEGGGANTRPVPKTTPKPAPKPMPKSESPF